MKAKSLTQQTTLTSRFAGYSGDKRYTTGTKHGIIQNKLQALADNSPYVKQLTSKAANLSTGIQLKSKNEKARATGSFSLVRKDLYSNKYPTIQMVSFKDFSSYVPFGLVFASIVGLSLLNKSRPVSSDVSYSNDDHSSDSSSQYQDAYHLSQQADKDIEQQRTVCESSEAELKAAKEERAKLENALVSKTEERTNMPGGIIASDIFEAITSKGYVDYMDGENVRNSVTNILNMLDSERDINKLEKALQDSERKVKETEEAHSTNQQGLNDIKEFKDSIFNTKLYL